MTCQPKLIRLETHQLYSRLSSCTRDSSVVLERLAPSIWSLSVCVCVCVFSFFHFFSRLLHQHGHQGPSGSQGVGFRKELTQQRGVAVAPPPDLQAPQPHAQPTPTLKSLNNFCASSEQSTPLQPGPSLGAMGSGSRIRRLSGSPTPQLRALTRVVGGHLWRFPLQALCCDATR